MPIIVAIYDHLLYQAGQHADRGGRGGAGQDGQRHRRSAPGQPRDQYRALGLQGPAQPDQDGLSSGWSVVLTNPFF